MTWLRGIYTDSSLHRMIMSTTGTLLHYLGGRKLRVRLSFVHPWGLLALGRLHLHYYGIGYGATYLEQVQITRCLVDTVVLGGHSKQTADKRKIYLQVYYLMIEDTSWIHTNGICLSKSSLCLVKLPKKKRDLLFLNFISTGCGEAVLIMESKGVEYQQSTMRLTLFLPSMEIQQNDSHTNNNQWRVFPNVHFLQRERKSYLVYSLILEWEKFWF